MSAADKFGGADRLDWSARSLIAVTPDDGVELAKVTKALYIGTAGNVSIRAADDASSVTFVGVPAGTILPVRARQVYNSGTTAGSIVALV